MKLYDLVMLYYLVAQFFL